MINFPYHIARAEGRVSREIYQATLPLIVRKTIEPPRKIDIDVFAYSGEGALPEQVASIRSFLRCCGRPKRFTVVSDGTYSPESIQLLEGIDSSVTVKQFATIFPAITSTKLQSYLTAHPTGKQLALIMSLPLNDPALYVDSDVLFFSGAAELGARAATPNAPAYYLPDCQFSGDPRLLFDVSEQQEPVNTGALLLFEKLDWSLSIDRFLKLDGEPSFFTNQTMTHLAMHANRARPLDTAKYVLRLDDQFIYRDKYANASLVMRHYVNPVRHKFWTHFAR
ncbi:MAG: hypothetical protein ABI925_02615 [Verrucomicrobiota bacterium]